MLQVGFLHDFNEALVVFAGGGVEVLVEAQLDRFTCDTAAVGFVSS